MSTITLTEPCCGCGTPVDREVPTAEHSLAAIPFWCDPCIDRDRERELAEEAEGRRREAARRVERSGVPRELRTLTWDDIDQAGERAEPVAAAQRWSRRELSGLVLTGPIGAGKTWIAATAATAMLADRFVHWTSAPLLFARLGSGFDTAERTGVLDLLTGNTPLVLDDIDKARPTEYGAEQVFLAVDQRMSNGVPLLVTTNLSSDGLRLKFPEPFGEAIASRLLGYCEGYRIGGQDRRRPA